MNNQQLAAMQGALLALEDAHRRDEHSAARWVYSEAMDALREALAQPQVALEVSSGGSESSSGGLESSSGGSESSSGGMPQPQEPDIEHYLAIKKRNAEVVALETAQPQCEPVAWLSQGGMFTTDKSDAYRWIANGFEATPLYPTAPSVEVTKEKK